MWDRVMVGRRRLDAPRPSQGMICRSRLENVSKVVVGRDNSLFYVSVEKRMERMVGWKVCFSEVTL